MAPVQSSGVRAWKTRQRGAYIAAINSLKRLYEQRDLYRLVLAFGTITDFLAPALPDNLACPLPYTLSINGEGEPSFALDGELLNPGIPDKLPSFDACERFAQDLLGPWLDRLAEAAGLSGREQFLWAGGAK